MRPIQLEMTAFGPYKETEIVDFEELGDHQLFTISGATGAGKTTIFDGICFALYGQASGEDRTEIRALRSHFAEDDIQTVVELKFAIQDKTYRIKRTIPYTKVGNKSETPGSVEFYMKQGDKEVPVVDRQIVSEVNEKVVEILGFTLPQFSQIVMLPQGEFRKFLTSSTENKEEIMRKIFKTEPYLKIVDRLKEKRDEAQSALQNETQNNASYVDKIAASLPERSLSFLFEVLAAEYRNTNQVVKGLEEERAYYEEKTKQDEVKYNAAFKKHGEMLSNFHQAKEINNQLDELNRYQTTLDEISKRLPEIEKKEKQLVAAEHTQVIEQLDRQYIELNKEFSDKKAALKEVEKQLEEAKQQLVHTTETYELERNKETERNELTEKLIGLKSLVPDVSALESRKKTIQKLEKALASSHGKLESAEKDAAYKKEVVETVQQTINKLEKEILPLDQIADELHEMREKSRLVEDYIEEERQVTTFEKTKKIQLQRYEIEKEQYNALANEWMMSEAATLAEMLREDEECPVCGSIDHPKKAHQMKGQTVVSKEALEQAKKQLETVENEYRKAVANYESASDRLKKQEQPLVQLAIDLKEIETTSAQYKETMTKLEQEQARLRESRQTLAKQKERLKKQQELAEKANENKIAIEKEMNNFKSGLQVERSVYENKIQVIPEELRVLSQLEKQIEYVEKTQQTMKQVWEKVQEQYQSVQKAATEAELNVGYAKTSLIEVEKKEASAKDQFYKALAESEFSTEEAYRDAKMDEASHKALKEEIEQFKQMKHATKERVTELTRKLEGKERADLQAWEVALEELKTVYEQALTEVNRSQSYEKVALELKESLLESTDRIAHLEQQFGKIADLHDVVRGQNEMRLSFERYIQIEYLERIIQSANERLSQLSSGQFEFVRSDRQEKNRRQSGLSLDVYDAYTGQTRDVKTLSGGEKFNASLCLALGMSDVIQSFQGSVSVDTMFIDEGFGSLDEESLNKSIDTLIELQKAGRMIGVISHVEELKMAFPARLEVTKSKEGHSKTEFIVK